jgi:hypothetical protein
MPPQEEHEKIENLVDSPHQAEHTARSLQEAADSNATLEGFEAINNERFSGLGSAQGDVGPLCASSEQLEREAREDRPKHREKGHPVP